MGNPTAEMGGRYIDSERIYHNATINPRVSESKDCDRAAVGILRGKGRPKLWKLHVSTWLATARNEGQDFPMGENSRVLNVAILIALGGIAQFT